MYDKDREELDDELQYQDGDPGFNPFDAYNNIKGTYDNINDQIDRLRASHSDRSDVSLGDNKTPKTDASGAGNASDIAQSGGAEAAQAKGA